MGKKQNEAVANAVTNLLSTAEKSIRETVDKTKTPTVKSLEDLKNLYETVDVRIRKRDNKTGKFAHLVTLERESPKNLEAIGLEEMCKDQAGGGEYQVWVRDPSAKTWMSALKFDGILISGPGYDMAKSDRQGIGAGFAGNLPATSANTGPSWAFQSRAADEMKEVMKQQIDQSTGMSDRMLMLMQNNNQQQMQMMQGFMAAMMGGGSKASSEDSDVRILKERIERMEQERRADERYARLEKEQSELKQQLLMTAAAPRQDKSNDILLALLTGQQTNQQAASNQYVELVREMIQRPSEDEKISNITGTMIKSFQGQMDLMHSALRNGLLSSGGPEHPVAQIVSQALEGLTQVATVAFENRNGGHREEEEEYEDAPGPISVMPSYDSAPLDQPALGYVAPTPQLAAEASPSGPEEEEMEFQAQIKEEDILLDDMELNRISRDTALSQILAKIQNGVPVVEATARLYAHARSNNEIAIKWISYPDIISRQVLKYYGMGHAANKLAENIVAFMTFLSEGGDANKWSEETGYKPIKEAVPGSTSVIPPAEVPEFGMQRGAPLEGVEAVEYDSSNPMSITPEPPKREENLQPETVEEETVVTPPVPDPKVEENQPRV